MVRSYSRSSGSTALDTESGRPGSSSAAIAAIRCSCAALA